jgi:putative intracellular protease/amidase/YHS domain-containing protein
MRRFSRRLSVTVPVICLAVCAARYTPGRPARADEKAPQAPVALKGLDPVLLVAGKEEKGKEEFAATSDGFRYRFVSAANKAAFEKDPQRYGIQFHGQCAMMKEARAVPDLFTVHKGRIYAFGSEGCLESFRESPEKYTQEEKPVRGKRSAVILVFNGMELLDFAGPAEVFGAAGFRVDAVAATREPVRSMGLVTVTPRYTFDDCPRADVIVVPGGSAGAVARDKRVTDWLARASKDADVTLSVCTGAFVLARAGLLDGKEATTHWSATGRLGKEFPQITVRKDQRVVDTGKVVTSAGVSAGIDGALHVVERLAGRPKATSTARYMEYNWQPPVGEKN